MPCLIITGYPSSGKSTLSRLLRARALLRDDVDSVVILNEESVLKSTTSQSYSTSLIEKQTRGAMKAALDRAIAAADSKCLILLDSLNYIKGQRYELFCLSKAASQKHGVVWVRNYDACSDEEEKKLCRKWNATKDVPIDKDLLEELIKRYEKPDDKNRWEDPLFVAGILHADARKADCVSSSSSAGNKQPNSKRLASKVGFKRRTKVSSSQDTFSQNTRDASWTPAEPEQTESTGTLPKPAPKVPSLEDQLDRILQSFLENTKQLQQGTSTRFHISTDTDTMHKVDTITHQVVRDLIRAQGNTCTGRRVEITIGDSIMTLEVAQAMAPAKLQRLRGQYLNWIRTHTLEDTTPVGMASNFLAYIQEAL